MEGLPASPASTVDSSSSGYPSFGDSDDDAGRGVDGLDGAQAKDKQPARFLPAIFIHAGAGFHSHQNERVHLEACEEAAAIGMRALRAGASAVDAVEAALRYLEDKEVTNAGFGSNLSIHGTVECDATIVDHLGRSGACGAVPNIRHPISLAKLILDRSKVPLTLRRVPPNILVGQGACSFAKEHGMPLCSNDALISKNARDRFRRWQEGLHRADARLQWMDSQQRADEVACGVKALEVPPVAPAPPIETMDLEGSTRQGDHVNAISTATWNEGQPDSPAPTSPALCEMAQPFSSRNSPSIGPRTIEKRPLSGALDSIWAAAAGQEPASKRAKQLRVSRSVRMAPTGEIRDNNSDGPGSPRTSVDVVQGIHDDNGMEASINENAKDDYESDEDVINDTIGAIAVDENGHLAAASSSGGIGMKHCGRIGPAALVGVGTAVIPGSGTNPDVSVAAVTSGTGEHMATTMASRRCAERIFSGTRMGLDGLDVAEDDEDAILQSFIRDDFMAHPGVTACHSAGAIGVMVVKRTWRGIYFYFAHNTDSFALASMGADETVPVSVMSRLREGGGSALGGRRIGVVRGK